MSQSDIPYEYFSSLSSRRSWECHLTEVIMMTHPNKTRNRIQSHLFSQRKDVENSETRSCSCLTLVTKVEHWKVVRLFTLETCDKRCRSQRVTKRGFVRLCEVCDINVDLIVKLYYENESICFWYAPVTRAVTAGHFRSVWLVFIYVHILLYDYFIVKSFY